MMAQINTSAVVRTAAPVQHIYSPLEFISNCIVEAINSIADHDRLKDDLWERMQKGMRFQNSQYLLAALRDAKYCARRQDVLTGSKILKLWQEAVDASVTFIRDESRDGHQGRALFATVFGDWMNEIDFRIDEFITSQEKAEDLEKELEDMIFEINNFLFKGTWCRNCGAPLPEDFQWRYCRECHQAYIERRSNVKIPGTDVTPRESKAIGVNIVRVDSKKVEVRQPTAKKTIKPQA